MIVYRCDGCGREMPRNTLRYAVKIDVQAAYDELEIGLAELIRDHRAELVALIDKMKDVPPKKIEETVYKGMKLDLCPSCQRAFIASPLRFHPEGTCESAPLDIDGFLKSLGYGRTTDNREG